MKANISPANWKKSLKVGVTVSCLVKSLKVWGWPDTPDVHTYPLQDIIRIINDPTPCGNRGQFTVPEVEQYWKAKLKTPNSVHSSRLRTLKVKKVG